MPRAWVILGGVVGCLAIIGGFILWGKFAKDDLEKRGHFDLVIADLRVDAPPGMTRVVFLEEVAYQSKLPATLNRTEPSTTKKLQDAFAAHPWVEKVVVGDLNGAEPVKLSHRVPTLAVGPRVVDRNGVLLPLRAPADGLPQYKGPLKEVTTPSGSLYADSAVVAVAKTLGWLKSQVPTMQWKTAELTNDGLVLGRADGGKAIWGQARPTEPTPEKKLEKLKEWKTGNVDLRK